MASSTFFLHVTASSFAELVYNSVLHCTQPLVRSHYEATIRTVLDRALLAPLIYTVNWMSLHPPDCHRSFCSRCTEQPGNALSCQRLLDSTLQR